MKISIITTVIYLMAVMLGCGFASYSQTDSSKIEHLYSINEGMNAPVRIFIDNQNIVYITDSYQNSILKYDLNGNFLGGIKPEGAPISIAVSNQGLIFIGDRKNGKILKLESNGTTTDFCTESVFPSCAVFGPGGQLFVVDSKRKEILVINQSGNITQTIGKGILILPTGITWDQMNNRILVSEHGGLDPQGAQSLEAKVHMFSPDGTHLGSFGEYGSKDGQFSRIQGLAVDKKGRIYVVDSHQGIVNLFDHTGTFIAKIGEFGTSPGEFNAPMDIAIDSENKLWITSMNNSNIEVFSTEIGGILSSSNIDFINNSTLHNYPNPFSEGTWIQFTLNKEEIVNINIYDITGKKVRTFGEDEIERENYPENIGAVYWNSCDNNGNKVSTGVYFYELRLRNSSKIGKMISIK